MSKIILILIAVTGLNFLLMAENKSDKVVPSQAKRASQIVETNLVNLIQKGDKQGIIVWAKKTGALDMNTIVAKLSPKQRQNLARIILTTELKGEQREILLSYVNTVISNPLLGFYVELFANTPIRVHPGKGGGYAAGSYISLADQLLLKKDQVSTRNTITHELFHIFNHREKGAGGISGLNEGTAIWIFKTAYPGLSKEDYALGLAEPTIGTIGYYRDIGLEGYPKHIPFGVPTAITAKGREVYEEILIKRDPSKLPVFDEEKLKYCNDTFFKDLNRNQDFEEYKKAFRKGLDKWLEYLKTQTELNQK